jgi:hypothetical protein
MSQIIAGCLEATEEIIDARKRKHTKTKRISFGLYWYDAKRNVSPQ